MLLSILESNISASNTPGLSISELDALIFLKLPFIEFSIFDRLSELAFLLEMERESFNFSNYLTRNDFLRLALVFLCSLPSSFSCRSLSLA